MTLKTSEQQNEDLRSQLRTAAADLTSKTDTLQQVQADRCHLEKQVKDMEKQAADLTSSAAASSKDLTDSQEREERLKGQVAELESALESSQQEVEQKTNQVSCLTWVKDEEKGAVGRGQGVVGGEGLGWEGRRGWGGGIKIDNFLDGRIGEELS